MPSRAPHPCNRAGCPELTADRYCPQHTQAAKQEWRASLEAKRGTARERGYTTRWDKARATFLRRNPLCTVCKVAGLIKGSELVDHIIPHRGDKRLFWDHNNWQPLCEPCHRRKTAREIADRKA